MLKRWAAWPWGGRWVLGGFAALVLGVAIAWVLLVPAADWLAHHDVGSAQGPVLRTARDAARGRLLTLGAGLFAAGALIYTARNFRLSREGQVTDRYTKAIEQLGSGKRDVRIGGIYALERIARDSAKDHPTVVEVLAAFIREHSPEPWPVPKSGGAPVPDSERRMRPDVEAAVRVIGRREAKLDRDRIDLNHAILIRANLNGADLQGANLRRVDLRHSRLIETNLSKANLRYADLIGVEFKGANFSEAELDFARWPAYGVPDGWIRGPDRRLIRDSGHPDKDHPTGSSSPS